MINQCDGCGALKKPLCLEVWAFPNLDILCVFSKRDARFKKNKLPTQPTSPWQWKESMKLLGMYIIDSKIHLPSIKKLPLMETFLNTSNLSPWMVEVHKNSRRDQTNLALIGKKLAKSSFPSTISTLVNFFTLSPLTIFPPILQSSKHELLIWERWLNSKLKSPLYKIISSIIFSLFWPYFDWLDI